MGYAYSAHTETLSLLALALSEVEIYTEIIERTGPTMIGLNVKGTPMEKPRPECALRSDAARRAHSLLSEFGLSPSSMGKVNAPPQKDQSNAWDALVNS